MTPSDQVRKYCEDEYIAPARAQKQRHVAIRVGDVHKALGFHNRVPLVVSALESKLFRERNRLKLVKVHGPGMSTTTTLLFELL